MYQVFPHCIQIAFVFVWCLKGSKARISFTLFSTDIDLIKSTDNTAFSFEILPPLKGTGIEKLYKSQISHSPTHWSMGLVSGLAFLFLLVLDEKKIPLPVKALLGGLFITLLELIAGIILNLHYHMGVWDYSKSFGDFKGQICPLFSLIWCFASFAVIATNRLLIRLVFCTSHEKKSHHS